MAIHARSTTAPTRPLPFVHRPALPSDDPRSAVEILDEIRREVERQEPGWAATAGLSPAQEALQTARRKELYDILHPETSHGGNKLGPTGQFGHTDNLAFVSDTSAKTGRAERSVRRDNARGESLGADLKRVSGTSLDPLPPPAPLPTLRTALSRRAALFGAVTATGFLGAALPAMATVLRHHGNSPADARLVALAAELLDVDTRANALDVDAPGYDALIERYRPLEVQMEDTPADTMVGVMAKARTLQIKAVSWCQNEIGNSIADDLCRIYGGARV